MTKSLKILIAIVMPGLGSTELSAEYTERHLKYRVDKTDDSTMEVFAEIGQKVVG